MDYEQNFNLLSAYYGYIGIIYYLKIGRVALQAKVRTRFHFENTFISSK
jgi:hypothetical protein